MHFFFFMWKLWSVHGGAAIQTSFSSSSKVNSFFLTTLSWLRKLNSAAFFCNLANLFSYLETFLRVGLTLKLWKKAKLRPCSTVEASSFDAFSSEYLQFTTEVIDLGVKVVDLFQKYSWLSISVRFGM